jgi:carboxyl-terminal processing protease
LEEKKSYDIVTLINGNSASASEVFASAMQEHGEYMVIGTTTYGKGVMQSTRSIQAYEGDQLTLTIGKWITPLGHWVQGIGVEPDVYIEPSAVEQAWNIYLGYGEEYMFDTVSERVENLQVILNGMGYLVRTDGYYDLATKEAVESIQLEHNLDVTGNVNQETAKVINEWLISYQIFNDTQLNEAIDLLSEE